jgi:hypothetical protein
MSNENQATQENHRWQSSSGIREQLAKTEHLDNIREAAALRKYFHQALFSADYKAALEW